MKCTLFLAAIACSGIDLSAAASEQSRRCRTPGVIVGADLVQGDGCREDGLQTPVASDRRGILPFVDVVIANDEECADVLGIRPGGSVSHETPQ